MTRNVGTTLLVVLLSIFNRVYAQKMDDYTKNQPIQHNLSQLIPKKEVAYIENKGQWDSQVKFLISSNGLDMWVTETGVVYDQYCYIENKSAERKRNSFNSFVEKTRKGHIVKVDFVGENLSRNKKPRFIGKNKENEIRNYFIGNNPQKHAQNVASYSSFIVENVFENIDAHYYIENNKPRYDFIVQPNGNPMNILMNIVGSEKITLSNQGSLQINTSLGAIEQKELYAYQQIGSKKQQIKCAFSVNNNGKVSFSIGEYDKRKPLIIDPLVFSTYLGGTGDELGYGIAVDANGDVYVTGRTSSSNFPVTSGSYQTSYGTNIDVFVTKMNSTGTALIYSTYLGGTANDQGNDIAVDANGNAYVTGFTQSTDFDITSGSYQTATGGGTHDAFVTKINPTGTALVYSTYLGGTALDIAQAIRVDGSGNAYVCGRTASSNYDIVSGSYQTALAGAEDAFITKVNATGSGLVYSTLLGGSQNEDAEGIAIDASGNAYVTGYTASNTNFDITSGVFQTSFGGAFFFGDAFVTKINSTGTSLVFSTYIGGSDDDFGRDIAVDASNNVYIVGDTYSSNYDLQNSIQNALSGSTDIFVTKFNSTGTALTYSTYLGGSDIEGGHSIALTSANEVVISGFTGSTDYDIVAGSFQTATGGGTGGFPMDAICTKFNAAGSALVYSSYLGGANNESGYDVALDAGGNAYVSGYTDGTDFDFTSGAYQTTRQGTSDAFITKFGIGSSITLTAPNTAITVCAGSSLNITWTRQNITNVKIELSSDGGSTFPTTIISSTAASAGTYSWSIPANQSAGTQYRIRISDASNSLLFDVSNANFTISSKAIFTISHNSTVLFPPNQSLRTISASISISGGCSPSWVLKSIISNEADNGVVPNDQSNDIQNATLNTADNSFSLRAERIPNSNGRTYTITYSLTDNGSTRDSVFAILVPLNLGFAKDAQQGSCIAATQTTPNTYSFGNAEFSAVLTSTATIRVRIFNGKGKDIIWLGQGSYNAGTHTFLWNGRDRNNRDVSDGTYFLQVTGDCGTSAPLTFQVNRP